MSTYPFVPAFTNPQGSPIRELFKYLSQPGMISFSGGSPASTLFDTEGLARASQTAFKNTEACLQYGATGGAPSLRKEIIKLMQRRGAAVSDAELIVTTGSQQGLDLLVRTLIEPGDTVLLEEPTYPATLQAFKLQGAKIIPLPSDAEGMDVEALDRMLSSGEMHTRPKMIYTVPSFANPTGATMSMQRRLRLLELAQQHQILLVEDDPYSELRFSGEAIPTLLALASEVEGARDWVVHFSSLSKIVAPGLRVGWTIAPAEITRRCTIAKQTADLCSPPWTQEIAAAYLRSEDLDQYTRKVSRIYGAKCQAMSDALREHFGDAIDFSQPDGGLFVWARLRNGVDAAKLLPNAIERNVIFVPGSAFYTVPKISSELRLSYATASIEEIREGISRLSQAFHALTA